MQPDKLVVGQPYVVGRPGFQRTCTFVGCVYDENSKKYEFTDGKASFTISRLDVQKCVVTLRRHALLHLLLNLSLIACCILALVYFLCWFLGVMNVSY